MRARVEMSCPEAAAPPSIVARRGGVRDFVLLTKPRVLAMVLVATWVGFHLASSVPDAFLLLRTLIGTALACAGTLALNQYVERNLDARMERTRGRPLPSGRMLPSEALVFGAVLTTTGLLTLTLGVNPLCGMVTATTVVTYLFLYTPMKRRNPLCSVVGAVPGALPPVTGWAAAAGSLGAGALALFAILFLWQLPHSLAIARLYAADYERAGFRLLPIVDRGGHSTERQIVANSVALLAAGLAPTLLGITGTFYFVAALLLGTAFLGFGIAAAVTRTPTAARRVLLASLVYLPVLFAIMALDKVAV